MLVCSYGPYYFHSLVNRGQTVSVQIIFDGCYCCLHATALEVRESSTEVPTLASQNFLNPALLHRMKENVPSHRMGRHMTKGQTSKIPNVIASSGGENARTKKKDNALHGKKVMYH